MSGIHPSSIIAAGARIGRDVSIGPFSIIEDDVEIGDGCQIAARVVIKSGTSLGPDNRVAEGAVLGGAPQHLRRDGDSGRLVIGRANQIRENATIHCGLKPGSDTHIGDENLLMVNAHVAHDCVLGNNIIVANNALLAGHVTVEDRAYVSGAVAVHQFCRIGRVAMVGGQAHITQDVPPFVTVDGGSSLVVGLNLIGLRRAGLQSEEIQQLKAAYRQLYRGGLPWQQTMAALESRFPSGQAAHFHIFLSQTKRGIVQERRRPKLATLAFPRAAAGPGESDQLARKAG